HHATFPAPTHRGRSGRLHPYRDSPAELAELKELILNSRLVTLTGIGGIGKSTLSVWAAHECVGEFRDGVWLIELGDLSNGELLVAAAAAALGIRDQTARPLLEVMVETLADRGALLVLDNCEHIIDAAVPFIQTLLARCPRLKILATSREFFDIDTEVVAAGSSAVGSRYQSPAWSAGFGPLRCRGVVCQTCPCQPAQFQAHRAQCCGRRAHLCSA
ncbi:hypothetical protein OSH39_23675, partial [Mycobacterium ulcerans]|nr:hypothetical protein [Mycobacterium ulcerans]MEB3910748.1 hypothetical protein [Mycobacterium ulcerans]MEB3921007.1 hypothetical protein [Mycobacterium ulcerans]MEB3925105.1 hypothetical protein [Mycobacterium ulcerans]MEB3929272.1 hypothetical protein [Mycobacterium ulcerans]